eukprot:COSAG05_NODE_5082_length_1269_cov_1.296581_2_plen_71_part_01
MSQTVGLMFGKGTVELELDEGLDVTVVNKPAMQVIDDPVAAITAAVKEPVSDGGAPACAPLEEQAEGKSTA